MPWPPTRGAPACACWLSPIRSIPCRSARCARLREPTSESSCGPSECAPSALASARLETDDDPLAFAKLAADAGFGDGLPLVPPTEERVRAWVSASGRAADALLAVLPPRA